MDLGILGQISFNWDFVISLFCIILIHLILSGDMAVIIALAVRSLPRTQRISGTALGFSLAVGHHGLAVVSDGGVHGPKEDTLVEDIAREVAGGYFIINQLVFRR